MCNWIDWHPSFTLSAESTFSRYFPLLRPNNCVGDVSDATIAYNCFAWAASDNTQRWDPDPWFQYYWPDNVPREYTIPAFQQAYGVLGYEQCDNGNLEQGFEKIAIYSLQGAPTHAARQLENGYWATKFGSLEDITHIDLTCLNGPLYGTARYFMKRVRS